MPFVCIGVPYWIGERQTSGPVDAVRRAGIADELNAVWVEVQPDFDKYHSPVAAVNCALAEAIQAHVSHTPLIFAADCVSALGAMKGLEAKRPAVLWYDAHGDFNTEETSPSGFLGGMPLAAMVGRGNEALMDEIGLTPIPEEDVLITDARDLDPEEGRSLAGSKVTHLRQIDDLMTVPLPDKPLYIHFDTDVVDSGEMPAMNYPTPNGPSMAQTLATVERVAADSELAGVLFSLWNQDKEGAKLALDNTLQVVRALTKKDSK